MEKYSCMKKSESASHEVLVIWSSQNYGGITRSYCLREYTLVIAEIADTQTLVSNMRMSNSLVAETLSLAGISFLFTRVGSE